MKPDPKGEWVFLADRIAWVAVEASTERCSIQSADDPPFRKDGLSILAASLLVSNSRFVLLHFTDPPDGAITYHVVGIEDEAA